jgi:hypothetical protein
MITNQNEFQKMLLAAKNLKRNISRLIEAIEIMEKKNNESESYNIENSTIISNILICSNNLNLLVKEIKTQYLNNSITPCIKTLKDDITIAERVNNALSMIFGECNNIDENKIIKDNFSSVLNEKMSIIDYQEGKESKCDLDLFINKYNFELVSSTILQDGKYQNQFEESVNQSIVSLSKLNTSKEYLDKCISMKKNDVVNPVSVNKEIAFYLKRLFNKD